MCQSFIKKSKKQYFNNIDVKNVADNKKFWKTMRTQFSNKCKTANTIFLVEDEKLLQVKKAIANTFNNYFTDVTYFLGLKKNKLDLRILFQKLWKHSETLRV